MREARGSEATPAVLAPWSQAEEEPQGSCRRLGHRNKAS